MQYDPIALPAHAIPVPADVPRNIAAPDSIESNAILKNIPKYPTPQIRLTPPRHNDV